MERKIHISQTKRFFALCNTLEYEAEEAKERAKKYFYVEHFNDLTVEQGAQLIEKLEARIDEILIKCPNCRGTGYIKKEKLENE